jgi:hypothetical protein
MKSVIANVNWIPKRALWLHKTGIARQPGDGG